MGIESIVFLQDIHINPLATLELSRYHYKDKNNKSPKPYLKNKNNIQEDNNPQSKHNLCKIQVQLYPDATENNLQSGIKYPSNDVKVSPNRNCLNRP